MAITDIMLDLETLAIKTSEAVVLSIGAYAFNRLDINNTENYSLHLIFGEKKFRQEQRDRGRVIDSDTVEFWKKQPQEAKKIFSPDHSNVSSVHIALMQFRRFYEKFSEKVDFVRLWGNDQLFDVGILGSLHRTYGMHVPWKWYEPRCYRTLIQEHKIVASKPENFGTPHVAIHDAKFQAVRLQMLFEKFRKCGIADER